MIVVHAPPRTGGVSVRLFLQANGFTVHHAHYLQNTHYYQYKRNVDGAIRSADFDKKVVTICREPIARNISEYWRRWFIDRPPLQKATVQRKQNGIGKIPGTHAERFYGCVDHYRQHQYFGGEIEPYWQVKLDSHTGPYTIFQGRLLLIQCEALNDYGVHALQLLLGQTLDGTMLHKNVVPTQREPIPITEAYIEGMYGSDYFPNNFYSQDQLDEWRYLWMTQAQQL